MKVVNRGLVKQHTKSTLVTARNSLGQALIQYRLDGGTLWGLAEYGAPVGAVSVVRGYQSKNLSMQASTNGAFFICLKYCIYMFFV